MYPVVGQIRVTSGGWWGWEGERLGNGAEKVGHAVAYVDQDTGSEDMSRE